MLQFNQILSRYFIKCTIQKIDAKIHIFYYSKRFFYKKKLRINSRQCYITLIINTLPPPCSHKYLTLCHL